MPLSKAVQEFLKEHDLEETIRKSMPFKSWVARKKEGNTIGHLSKNQKKILLALSKHPKGMTRDELLSYTGIAPSNASLAITTGTKTKNVVKGKQSLREMRLVRQKIEDDDGYDVKRYHIMEKGLKAAKALSDL